MFMEHTASQYRMRYAPCRCDECRADHRRRHAAERAKRHAECVVIDGRRVAVNPAVRHGTTTAYSYHGCQCEQCTAANADCSRRYRLRKGIRS